MRHDKFDYNYEMTLSDIYWRIIVLVAIIVTIWN